MKKLLVMPLALALVYGGIVWARGFVTNIAVYPTSATCESLPLSAGLSSRGITGYTVSPCAVDSGITLTGGQVKGCVYIFENRAGTNTPIGWVPNPQAVYNVVDAGSSCNIYDDRIVAASAGNKFAWVPSGIVGFLPDAGPLANGADGGNAIQITINAWSEL